MRYKTIITYGTYDLFHVGHVRLLKRLKELAETVIVGVSTDEFNQIKGKRCIIPFEQRIEIVRNMRQVDLAIPECDWGQKVRDIEQYSVDAFAMGSDWTGKFDELEPYCDVIYLDRTDGISTTEIKGALSSFGEDKIILIKRALEIISIVAEDFK